MYPQYSYDKSLVKYHPSERQIAVARMEFYAFICFNMNTFTYREWGDGKESPSLFNPTESDPLFSWTVNLLTPNCQIAIVSELPRLFGDVHKSMLDIPSCL